MKKIIYVFFFTVISFFPACNSDSNPLSSLSEVPKNFNEAIFSGYYGGHDFSADNQGNIYHSSSYTDSITIGNIKLSGGDAYNSYLAKYNKTNDVIWAVSLENAIVRQIKVNRNGELFVVGGFYITLKIGDITVPSAGTSDIFMAKFNGEGKLLWLKNIGGVKHDEATAIAYDQRGNILLTGRFEGEVMFDNVVLNSGTEDNYAHHSNVFIASFNSSGQLNWVRQGGGKSIDISYAVCTDNDNNVIITGEMYTPAQFDNFVFEGNNNIFVVKYNKDGGLIWAQSFGDASDNDTGFGVIADASGNIYITGWIGGPANFGDIILTPGTNIDGYLVKISGSGIVQWAKQTTAAGYGAGLSLDAQNNLYYSGSFYKTANFGSTILNSENEAKFIASYNANGTLTWAEKYEFNY